MAKKTPKQKKGEVEEVVNLRLVIPKPLSEKLDRLKWKYKVTNKKVAAIKALEEVSEE